MSMGFEEYLSVLDDKDLEEIPVDIDTFVEDEHYLGKRRMKLSPIQRECVLMMTQMYRLETLESFMDEKSAQERWSQTKKEIILQLGKGCHAPYTPVYNAETGSWQRLDSFDQYNNTVIGYTDGKLTPEYATESFLEGEGRMLRVVTRLGFTEDVYEGHKYYAWKNKHFFKRNNKYHKGPEWIEAKDLDASYKIAIGAGFDVINPINIPEAHATFLGYVIGDGCCPNDQYGRLNVDFHEDETDSMAAYRAAVDEIGDSIKFTKHPKKKMFYVTHGRQMKTYSLIKEYGLWGSRAQDKFIPDAVWRSDNNILAKFMSALWATDGSVYLKKLKSSSTPVAEYCTISERLAHDVQRALLRLGIAAGIRSRRPTYTYKKEKKTGQTAYYITVSGSENFKRFASVITLFDQKQSKAAGGLDIINRSSYRQNMYHQGLYWDNIKSIEDIGNGLYWTMTQPNSSNYLGNGCISQQSGKDELSAIAIAYIVYLLLCLRDPAAYYKKPAGDNIDILNIAINSDQAKNVFFKKFNNFITVSPWFQGRYDSNASGGPAKADKFEFDKNITVYSGHSEKEAWEGYNCRTPDVEALTREGWKTYDRLTVGEEIYTIDHETGAGEWQPLERINVFDVDEDIIRFSGKHFTATSTADHRWPTITRYGTRRWKTTSTLNTGDNIPLKATNAGLPTVPKYDDNFVELIAWYMTEGTINRSHTEIYQSAVVNPDNVNRIRKCLTGCFGPGESSLQRLTVPQWRENLRRGVVEFKMNRVIARVLEESAPGRVPTYEFMNSLTLAQLELFISVCMLADNRGPDCFAQKNYQMAEVFAFACIQTGRAISCREVKCGDYKMLNVRIRRKSVVNPIAAKIERQIFRYQGKVWCPTVKNGTWLSREGGTVHFTGNCIAVVLDEISGFAIESASPTGKTAQGIYDMYKASVVSRFAGFGKLICLSFPRYKGDFITKRYNEVIGGKQVVAREVVTKINDELPDGVEGNELVIQWEEDHIDYYTERWVYALRRPPWDVNPTVSIEDYVGYFLSNYTDAMGRFACMPPDAIDAFFKDRARIEAAMDQYNGWDHSQGQYADENIFAPEPGKEYFVHVDLAQKHDRCAVAMAHVEKWVRKEIMGKVTEPKPFVRVDLLRFWEPKIQGEVDFQEVQDFIVDLQRKGFNLRLVTFDQWRCLRDTTLVETSNGPVTLGDLRPGDTVMTRMGPAQVGAKFDTGIQEVFRIKTRLGYELEATWNHKMLTRDGWKTVGQLTENDELLISSKSFPDRVDVIDEDQAYVFGALIADGWINNKDNLALSLTTPDKDFLDRFEESIRRGWGYKNSLTRHISGGAKCFQVNISQKEMILRMRAAGLGLELSHTKTVPYSVLNGSISVKSAFLAGYMDGDGGVHHYIDTNGSPRVKAEMNTTSEILAKQLAWMFLSMGLEPSRQRLTRNHNKNVGETYRFIFEGRKAERFFSLVTPAVERKSRIDNIRSKNTKERWTFENNEMWLKIKSIQSIGEHQTYDINVPEYNEFIADGFVTHNSEDMRKYLNSVGIRSELLSIKKEQYVDFAVVMQDYRLKGPKEEKLIEEMTRLRLFPNGKIDHTRRGYKDLSDATCGAIFNAVTKTRRDFNQDIEIMTLKEIKKVERNRIQEDNVIVAPSQSKRMPQEIADLLERFRVV